MTRAGMHVVGHIVVLRVATVLIVSAGHVAGRHGRRYECQRSRRDKA